MKALAALALLALASCNSGDAAVTSEAKVAAHAEASADTIDATVKGFFAPYQSDVDSAEADWDRPIYSASLRALIERWKQGFTDEGPLELQDFGWLCECQDWDAAKFTAEMLPPPAPENGKVKVTARFDAGWGETRDMTFVLVEDNGEWRIDDIRSGSFEGGLRASLERAIAAPAA